MNRIFRASLSFFTLLVLSACLWFGPVNPANPEIPIVRLTVQTQNGVNTFSQVGEAVTYTYTVTNTGITPLAGPVTITDAPRQATCPAVNTVGNQDSFLDLSETVTCTATYNISQSDFNTGSVTNLAQATVGGQISNQSGVTLTRTATPQPPSTVLTLAKSANPQSYSQVGQTITYTYVITNVGTTPLGPAQFMITDSKLGAPFACGLPNTTIAPNQPLNCAASYIITQADLNSTSITNTATASGALQTSAAASATITNGIAPTATLAVPPAGSDPCANQPAGSTCQHQVAVGEWMIQIARCYGARYEDVRDANRQVTSNPNFILPSMVLTVPRIGSVGRVWGKPCVVFHTVIGGDTWASIAQQYNADVTVLQKVNPGGLVTGKSVKVPRNSAGAVGATAVPLTPQTPNPPAQRITIPPGQTTTSMIGLINPNQTIQFLLSATAGQTLTLQLTAPTNEVAIGVNSPTGIAIKPLDASPNWTTTVTATGDHVITLASIAGNTSKSYTLRVDLTTAAAPTFTSTATATPTVTPSTPAP